MRELAILSVLVALLLQGRADAHEPYLVKDIYPGNSTSPKPPSNLTAVGNILYFVAYGVDFGVELWKSDGSATGTVMVKDICPGAGGSDPKYMTNVNGVLFFSANDGANGIELWKSDGTVAGTVMVKDLASGMASSSPQYLTNVNGTLFFSANAGISGGVYSYELWKSDGTDAGTIMVKKFNPHSPFLDYQCPFANVNNTLFLAGDDGLNGNELWKSDGTVAGTVMVKDICSGSGSSTPASSYPSNLTSVNGTLFFTANINTANGELWKSDGTYAGTVLLKKISGGAINDSRQLVNVNGTLFFTDSDSANGSELWESDGTVGGTMLVKDIYPGSYSSSPAYLTNVNGTLFFSAKDGTGGGKLWKSNGTATGTVMVKAIYPGDSRTSPPYLTNVNGTLFFSAADSVNGYELWKSDGTTTGTVLVKDIYPGNQYSFPGNLTNVNGTLFFTARDGINGTELWALETDGKAPVINPLSDATIPDDKAYTGQTPTLTEGTTPITWSLVQNPSGMTINTTTGVVSWPTPATTGSPFTVKIRATNAFGQANVSWKLTVYHPGPPTTPQGGLVIAFKIRTPSVSPDGQPVQYTYAWTSDSGDRVTHGPTTATMDVLDEMNLVDDGETWTVRATPSASGKTGTAEVATVRFINLRTGTAIWSFYK